MMPTYTPIQSITTISTSTEITFSNIPQIYQDLVVVASMKGTTGTVSGVGLQFNGDTSSLYSFTYVQGTGSAAQSARTTNQASINIGPGNAQIPTASNTFGPCVFNVQNYSNATTNKAVIQRGNNSSEMVGLLSGVWRSTAAITSMRLFIYAGSFDSGCTFDLYGISPVAAQTTKAFGGTEIYYDSTYAYHVFKGSGSFTPLSNITADVLVIAGGGAGGSDGGRGGGGGAGGLRFINTVSLSANTTYPCLIGAGGSRGSTSPDIVATSGTNSTFGSFSSTGGGRGGTGPLGASPNGASGGSGGGAISYYSGSPGSGNAGSYSPVEGYSGGSNGGTFVYGAGGGGGAGGVGQNGSGNAGGNGGVGYQDSVANQYGLATSTGVLSAGNYYYAGGGAGGSTTNNTSGGLGGGGSWNFSTLIATSGFTNTGGGGAGGGAISGSGGSGIVIVRYPR